MKLINHTLCFLLTFIIFACVFIRCEKSNSTEKKEYPENFFPFSDLSNTQNWIFQSAFSDEFLEDTVNSGKWATKYSGWNGRHPSWFVSQNVVLNNGKLEISMKKEHLPEMDEDYEYSTGLLRSKFTLLYGYFEIKAKCMNSAGSSAFYLNNATDKQWSEIDVFEIGGNAAGHEKIIYNCLHEFYNHKNVKTPFTINEDIHYVSGGNTKVDWNPVEDFHVYGLDWNRDSIHWYIDGEKVRSVENTRWHQLLHVAIDSQTMPDWWGLPKDEDLPSTFFVDYIRIWQ